jgi:predicted amidohydrolase YtcJ
MIIIIQNARIYTLDPEHPTASAIVIDGERILGVERDREVGQEWIGVGKLDIIDAGGRTIIPGLTDAHIHLEQYALGLQKVDCETSSRYECLRRVAERAAQTPPNTWILGHGWNQNNWPEGFGNVADLDAVTPSHPVYLTAKSLHAAWVNSAAMKSAGIHAGTSDPAGGQLSRDEHGNPSGILFENAMELVHSIIPESNDEQLVQTIQSALPLLARMGLTGLHDFDRRRCFVALQTLHERGEQVLRVVKSIPLEDLPHATALGLRSGFGDDFLCIGGIKAFADGALGPRTAAMLRPYEGEPDNTGMLFLDAEAMFEYGRLAVDNGFSLAVHAIGDRANHEVLNAFSQLRKYERDRFGRANLRHRIEHVQLIHPDDAGRLGALGIVASMQPIHAPSDMLMADRYWGERAEWSYAWRTQLDHAARLAFGSDAPVESPNPFWGLHAAVTRRRLDGSPGPRGWHPDQRLSIQEALRGFTAGPAYVAYLDDRLGKLAPGYLADLLILDRDPFTCEPDTIKNIHPVATMVGGNWIYRNI